MSREIKLKAFARGNIVDVVSIDFINKYITWDDNQYDRCYPPNKCFEIESFKEITLMQFTGLKDKNGKDIYGGDLILSPFTSEPVQVIYDNEFAQFTYGGAEFNVEHKAKYTEVIGNIYETPQLLQQDL